MFGIFHDAGYKGLYGGIGSEEIKKRKRIDSKENLMDRMNATELAANQFRITQTRAKLVKAGNDVTFLARGEHLNKIKKNGLIDS